MSWPESGASTSKHGFSTTSRTDAPPPIGAKLGAKLGSSLRISGGESGDGADDGVADGDAAPEAVPGCGAAVAVAKDGTNDTALSAGVADITGKVPET
jgi:hypothetical protein